MADWDAKYAGRSTGLFGDEPNEYLRQIVARSEFAASSALCLADGDGRNGRWLAARGLDVTAVDISEIAAANAAAFDRQTGLAVERVVADLANWAPPDGRVWDAVFLFYLQCDAPTRLRALKLASQALARNGWFVLEAFAKSQAITTWGRPIRRCSIVLMNSAKPCLSSRLSKRWMDRFAWTKDRVTPA